MAAEILELPSRRRRVGRLRPRSSLGASHFSSISPPLPAPGASQMLHLPLPNLHLALISACGAAPRRLLPLPARGKPLRRRCHARAKDAVMLRGAHGDAEGQEGADPQGRASQGEVGAFGVLWPSGCCGLWGAVASRTGARLTRAHQASRAQAPPQRRTARAGTGCGGVLERFYDSSWGRCC